MTAFEEELEKLEVYLELIDSEPQDDNDWDVSISPENKSDFSLRQAQVLFANFCACRHFDIDDFAALYAGKLPLLRNGRKTQHRQ